MYVYPVCIQNMLTCAVCLCVYRYQANEHAPVVTDSSIQNFYLQEIPQHLEVHTNYTYRMYKIPTLILSTYSFPRTYV